jgi:hypothetical protein
LPEFHAENSICAIPVCSYVGCMSWQNILTLVIVLGVAVFFVWRSSGSKKHGCNCGCGHEHAPENQKDKAAPDPSIRTRI